MRPTMAAPGSVRIGVHGHAREPMGADLGALGNGRGRGSEQARRERRSGRIGLPAD